MKNPSVGSLILAAYLCIPSGAALAGVIVTVNPFRQFVLEGDGGQIQFTFASTGAASRIGGVGIAQFPTTGDATDNISTTLNYGNCDPFGNNVLGTCTMTVQFTSPAPAPGEFPDDGRTTIRGGILLANGQMGFAPALVIVNDALPFLQPPPPALAILSDFARVNAGDSGVLNFVVTNIGEANAVIAQMNTDRWFFWGNNTDDAGILGVNGCNPGTVLAPNASCLARVAFFTPFTSAPVEDYDFGVTAVDLDVVLTTGNSSDATGAVYVADVVPEPTTVVLCGIGMFGMLCARRQRGRLAG